MIILISWIFLNFHIQVIKSFLSIFTRFLAFSWIFLHFQIHAIQSYLIISRFHPLMIYILTVITHFFQFLLWCWNHFYLKNIILCNAQPVLLKLDFVFNALKDLHSPNLVYTIVIPLTDPFHHFAISIYSYQSISS